MDSSAPIRVLRDGEFRTDAALKDRMRDLIAPSYEAEPSVLEQDWLRCDTVYLLFDSDRLLSFFMTAQAQIVVDGERTPAFFLGLSAASPAIKNTGRVREIFRAFLTNARTIGGPGTWCFGYTATPSSVHAVQSIWAHTAPRVDGTYDAEHASVARAAATWLSAIARTDCPFVLPGYANGTRYSASERARIESIVSKTGFDLFRKFDVDERRGDRLLLVSQVPAE